MKIHIVTIALCLASASSLADTNISNIPWNQYLKSIESYSNDKTSESENSVQKKMPISTNIDSNQIRQQMEKNHQDQTLNIKKLFNEKTTAPTQTPSADNEQRIPVQLRDYVAVKKTRFKWNGKSSGYEYADYEITIDPRSESDAKEFMDFISKMSANGWEIDLSRSSQNSAGTNVISVNQMRFKRKRAY